MRNPLCKLYYDCDPGQTVEEKGINSNPNENREDL